MITSNRGYIFEDHYYAKMYTQLQDKILAAAGWATATPAEREKIAYAWMFEINHPMTSQALTDPTPAFSIQGVPKFTAPAANSAKDGSFSLYTHTFSSLGSFFGVILAPRRRVCFLLDSASSEKAAPHVLSTTLLLFRALWTFCRQCRASLPFIRDRLFRYSAGSTANAPGRNAVPGGLERRRCASFTAS